MNINDRFTAVLTKTGASIYNTWDAEFKYPGWTPKNLKEGDTLTCPLWQLFQIFGPWIHMGMIEVPFEDNKITPVGDEKKPWQHLLGGDLEVFASQFPKTAERIRNAIYATGEAA